MTIFNTSFTYLFAIPIQAIKHYSCFPNILAKLIINNCLPKDLFRYFTLSLEDFSDNDNYINIFIQISGCPIFSCLLTIKTYRCAIHQFSSTANHCKKQVQFRNGFSILTWIAIYEANSGYQAIDLKYNI